MPPEILIFFHMSKTGGTSMDGILSRCFPGDHLHFDGALADTRSALSIRPRGKIEAEVSRSFWTLERLEGEIRCLMGTESIPWASTPC